MHWFKLTEVHTRICLMIFFHETNRQICINRTASLKCFYKRSKWQERKWGGLSVVHGLVDHSFLLRIPKYRVGVSMNTLKGSEMLKTFPNSQFFSFSGILVIWKSTRWAAALSSFNLMSAASGQFPCKVGGTVFPCTDFFKSMLRPVASAFALNLSWAIATGTIFYNDILNTYCPINVCCMLVILSDNYG